MKWAILSASLLGMLGFAQTTYIPDENFEQILIDYGYDDVLDNYVSTSNINNVTHLNLAGKNISDLSGLEDFTNLTHLDCENNHLTELNITQNTALTFLNCGMNQLTSLDLSHNIYLTQLAIHENSIEQIDLSQNTQLTHLTAQQAGLTRLDLSQNSRLVYIACWENELQELNIQNGNNYNLELVQTWNNPNLTCIQVDDENWAENILRNKNQCSFDSWTSFSEDCKNLAIIENNLPKFSAFPNPAKNILNFSEKLKTIEIYSSNGKKIMQSNNINNINVSHLFPGTYFIKATGSKGENIQTTFVKK